MNQSWALYNALKYWTLYNLSENEVKLLLMTFSDNELKLAKVCRQGGAGWTSVTDESLADLIKSENKKAYSDADNYPSLDFGSGGTNDTRIFSNQAAKVSQPRQHNRYEKKVVCAISNANNRVFVTESQDLSEGGLHFRDVIPDWVAGYFIVVIQDEFQLMCSLVEDQKEKTRVQIVASEDDPQYLLYKEWLKSI